MQSFRRFHAAQPAIFIAMAGAVLASMVLALAMARLGGTP